MPASTPDDDPGSDASRRTSLSLLVRARSGNDEAWRRLVELYAPLVRHWCRQFGLPAAETDDVAQEVFAAAVRSLSDFRRDRPGDTFRGWLRGIARNRLLEWVRRRQSEPPGAGGTTMHRYLEDVPDPGDGGGDCPADAGAISDLLHRALEMVRGEFEHRTWQAFWQTVVDGRLPRDVALDLGMTRSAVRMAKSRVLRRVRQEVGDIVEVS
jgi:RNA polymerase sigma-70 factor (ECF subfamily)